MKPLAPWAVDGEHLLETSFAVFLLSEARVVGVLTVIFDMFGFGGTSPTARNAVVPGFGTLRWLPPQTHLQA